MARKRLVVLGFMGSCPISGVVWQHVHYIVGLMALGHDVYYIEDSARIPYNPETFETSEDYSHAARVLHRLAQTHGFDGRWAYRPRYLPGDAADQTAGMPLAKIRELYRSADALLNVCGSHEIGEDLAGNDRLVYVESDPGVEQIRIDNGESDTAEYLRAHRALFTFGENVGLPACPVPVHGFEWKPTRQPVLTEYWRTGAAPPGGSVFTTIANWSTSGKKDIVWRGKTYLWSKSLEFLKFVNAPAACGEPFEMATDIPEPETRERFVHHGWRLIAPHALSADFDGYRRYIQHSRGEFTVAKDQYVRLRTGWFSDRSACYLAAGRPVITQETGFTAHYGGKHGLLAFETPDDIPELIRAVNADYPAHSRGARDVACEYFEASRVLSSLLERAGV